MATGLTIVEPARNVEAYRASTDAASLCKKIVVASATTIQGRKYVCVEGWQAIAVAHGCTASARDVERVEDGVRAIGEIRRMADGQVIATAEGFVGADEPVWFGGKDARGKTHVKRPDYAIRAMAQTRAISRASRSAFAHVVVMMNAGLSTTPAEEVPAGGFEDQRPADGPRQVGVRPAPEPEQPRQKAAPLQGPIKTRKALRDACGDFVSELQACGDRDTLEAFLATDDAFALVQQVEAEAPFFWEGDGGDFLGLAKEIEHARLRVERDAADWTPSVLDAG
jgi:hypothetical protein